MIIVPAIDIIGGQCVRLTKGDYNTTKVYNTDPLHVAKEFVDAGLTHLHLVDLDGARKREVVNWAVLEDIAKHTNLKIDFSGGLSNSEQVKRAFDSGAVKVTIGSMAVKRPNIVQQWILDYGHDKIILGADVIGHNIAIHGWEATSEVTIFDFIRGYHLSGIRQVMCTDVSKDGMLEGAAVELYRDIIKEFPDIQLVASGGVSQLQDLKDLREVGCAYAIVGKAIYEGRITLSELANL
ncbi:MAG: 1-(5-phosphoribosyl)-5-[(5-phosphoribosylamino)methylideneamino]imidazole-4-carboxamide isomerase [Chitinophagales bacterium]|nr:1-(5-phosphoribosyl)-5-[(5-phosphoribosylamino)methylideneamino]imidazole-4-carboxamide isomerase [Chitinophagales bacterium]MCZ2393213.1 1-(5-phosphoribosyl)-5-[(5-phosphoribosylamino)methylideneamino]imidazole-4-carboxamide isomerase [Chitinophagales bacterium]